MDRPNSAPGFHNLGLEAGYTAYPSRVETKKSFLQAALRHESPIVHKAIKLLQNEMYSHLPRRENDVLRGLKELFESDRKHLNTLAQIESVYRKKGNTNRADTIARDIHKIRSSKSHDAIRQHGIFLLEQAYALLFDESTDTECSAYQKLYEAHTILKLQKPKSEEQNSKLQEAVSCTNKALRSASLIQKQSNYNADFTKLEDCIAKFKTGLSILKKIDGSESEIVTWSFYLAMALNRKAEEIFYLAGRETKEMEMKDMYLESIDCFWSVINKLPSDTTDFILYRARSYAYIGNILAAKESLFKTVDRKYPFQDDEIFNEFFYDLLDAARKTVEMLSTDETVLDRCGRIFRLMAIREQNNDNKLKCLEEAERLLSLSIELKPQMSKRTFSPRMLVYFDLADIDKNNKDFLLKARNDGLRCLENNITIKNLATLAKVCQRLAKFPKGTSSGKEVVVDKEYLHEAIDHITFGIRTFGLDYNFSCTMSSCMFDLGELRASIEWSKISIFLNRCTTSFKTYIYVCTNLLELYRDNIKQQIVMDIFEELLTVFEEMQASFNSSYNAIYSVCTQISRRYKGELIKFDEYLTLVQKTPKQETIAKCVHDVRVEQCRGRPRNRILDQIQDHTCTLSLLDQFKIEEALKNRSPTKILYDYFLLHTEDSARWLKYFLLYHLEEKLHDDDKQQTVCFAERDFDPEDTIEMSTVKAIRSSSKTLLVMTNAFLSRMWPNIKICLVQMMAIKEDCIVIILLEHCAIPEELKNVTCLDFKVRNKIPHEIQRLKL